MLADSRPAVLLVHGYMCNRAVWRDWLRSGPLNVSDSQLDGYITEIQGAVSDSTGTGGVEASHFEAASRRLSQ